MRHALIEDGIVINVIVWDGESPYDPGEGVTIKPCSDLVGAGFTYNGKKFTPPELEPEPSPLQGLRDELAVAASVEEVGAVVSRVIDALEVAGVTEVA
jgi:hypothetical protein